MLKDRFLKGPNYFHPEKPSAVGSRNSIYREGRVEYQESSLLVDEEVDKILNHVSSKLPPEVLSKIDVMGGVKTKIHNYYNLNFQNMLNRYMVTAEDELAKKYRDMVGREEYQQLNRYTPRVVSDLINSLGQPDFFNTEEIEKSIASTYVSLQSNIERSVANLEKKTNALLLQKTDVGAFLASDKAYNLVKCSFKNSSQKPRTVVDIKMAVNVLDAELVNPIYHYQKPIQDLLKEVISNHIHQEIDKRIEAINVSMVKDEKLELNSSEMLFEKFKALEAYLDFDGAEDSEESKKYQFVSKATLDALDAANFASPDATLDPNTIRQTVKSILDTERIQSKGFNNVVGMLTTILDNYKLGYQYINNLKNARSCTINEYSPSDPGELPDETFAIKISYNDLDQLKESQKAYDTQAGILTEKVQQLFNVVEKVYDQYTTDNKVATYQDLALQFIKKGDAKEGAKESSKESADDGDKGWNELVFSSKPTEEKVSTNQQSVHNIKNRLKLAEERIGEIFSGTYPHERFVLEERLAFLRGQFSKFTAMINPHHIQQGLVIEMDVTSVKKNPTTLKSISNVLNELLFNISKKFVDQSMVDYHVEQTVQPELLNERFANLLDKMDASLAKAEL
ncbi:MAG: cytoplasmic filament protein CfpA [SAR324 cluster bacterium]|nr:cytoplasmic filament protein CfpA [SAR324 cluster bacterium]